MANGDSAWANSDLEGPAPAPGAGKLPRPRTVWYWAAVLLVGVALTFTGCPCVRNTVNASPALRWWLFANFGAQRICPEMLQRGAPLRYTEGGNVAGRYFPTACRTEVNDASQTINVHFSGSGYGWTPLAGRVGFTAEASIECKMDFWMGEDVVYVWARTSRILRGPEFKIGSVENKVVDWAARTPVGYVANLFGGQIMSSRLTDGFTVVRSKSGDEFALGILQPPERPLRVFDTGGGKRIMLANEATEVHPGQIDFLGPFQVYSQTQELQLRMMVQQGPTPDAVIVTRSTGELWRESLQLGAPLGPPPQPAIVSFTIPAGGEQKQRLRLAPGQYFVVIDNSDRVGQVSPGWTPLGSLGTSSTVLAYTAELGDLGGAF